MAGIACYETWAIDPRTLGPWTLGPKYLKSQGPRGRGPKVLGALGPRPIGPWDLRYLGPKVWGPKVRGPKAQGLMALEPYLMLGYSNIKVFEYMYDLQWHIGFSSSVHLPIFQR